MRTSWLVAALALALWALVPLPIFGTAVLAYLAAWGIVAALKRPVPPWVPAALAATALPVLALRAPEIAGTEQLAGLGAVMADRARVADTPSIAPPIAVAGRTIAYFVHAPGAERLTVAVAEAPAVEADALGHGLFRVDLRFPEALPSATVALHLDAGSGPVLRTLRAFTPGPHPRGLVAREGLAAAVSEETDALYVLAAGGGAPRVVHTGDGPTDCALLDGGMIAVSHRDDPELWLVSPAGEVVRRVAIGAGQRHVAALGDAVAVSRAREVVIVPLAGDPTVIPLSFPPDRIMIGKDLTTLVVSSRETLALHLLEGGAERRKPIVLGRPAAALARTASGAAAVAAVSDFLPDRSEGANHEVHDQLVTIDLARWRISSRLETAVRDDGEVVGGASPVAIAERGGELVVAFAGSDEVAGYAGGARRWARKLPFAAPSGIASAGGALVVSSAVAGVVMIGDRVEALAEGDDLVRRGERAFVEATRSGASCQSCHLDGDSDGALHDIGHGVGRPTLSVLGVAGTSPYLRGASYPAVAGLEHFAATILGGYARELPDRAAALEAYVESLALPYNPRRSERAGAEAFVRARCDHCHAFPAFTDLAQRPARVIFPDVEDGGRLLDTPSLRGLAESAPYLDDGRAKTIDDVLEAPRTRHGDLERLGPDERVALRSFLESL